jgi:protein-L-isoaspartate(D-aspartate) O-methyltransferase
MNDYKNCMDLNKNMVEGQIKPLGKISPSVLEAFLSIPRDLFVPPKLKNLAYLEKNLELDNDRFLLKPSLIAKIISIAEFEPSDTVLIIGSSTGYSSAILSNIAETVISIEENDALINFSESAVLNKKIDNVVFLKKDLNEGCPEHGPFNKILIEGAVEEIPKYLFDQLDENGKMIAIISNGDLSEVREYNKVEQNIGSKFLFSCEAPKLKAFNKSDSFNF